MLVKKMNHEKIHNKNYKKAEWWKPDTIEGIVLFSMYTKKNTRNLTLKW